MNKHWSNETKVLRYIMEKEEVSITQLQRDFSHRLNAKELDEILYMLEDSDNIRIRLERREGTWDRRSPYPWEWKKLKGRGRQFRRTCVAIVIKALKDLREQKNLGRDKEREPSTSGGNKCEK